MPQYKKQHYLPRFYLEGFSSEEIVNGNKQNIIWYYDKDKQIIKSKSIENIAWKPFYYSYKINDCEYDLTVEKYFSDLENETAKVIKKIEKDVTIIIRNYNKKINDNVNKGLSENEKNVLLIFLFYMLKRVPAFVDKIEEEWKVEYQKLRQQDGRKFDENEFKSQVVESIMKIGARNKMNFIDLFKKRNIDFLYNNFEDSNLITTDDPIITMDLEGPEGFAYESTNIFFPLSKKLMMRLYKWGNKVEIKKILSKEKLFKDNCDIALNSCKYIFCCRKEYLIKILRKINLVIN
jgi:hypothetical protein